MKKLEDVSAGEPKDPPQVGGESFSKFDKSYGN